MPPRHAARLDGLGTTIFTEMTALAQATGAVNLGQGFPDEDGPAEVVEAAVEALRAGHNQYAPLAGVPVLRQAVAAHQREHYGLEVDPDAGVQVTFGATEAISAALLALVGPGDEVVVLEPAYDSYGAAIAFAGATAVPVALRPPGFLLDPEVLRAAITPRTRAIIVNTPHNPTGRVLNRGELAWIADVCREHDLVAISDEVYEHLVFTDRPHIPLATLDGMWERTITVSSVGKTASLTGWKTGWASGPPELVGLVTKVKQFLTFSGGTPFHHASAVALALPAGRRAQLREDLRLRRDVLCAALRRAGLVPLVPEGTYFVNVDVAPLGVTDGRAFCRELPARAGVVGIPTAAFTTDPELCPTLVRFAFCKTRAVVDAGAAALARLTVEV